MIQILERGDLQFWFRPTVRPADVEDAPLHVQQFFVILSPAGGARHRRIRIGRKRMPERPGQRLWARVERVGPLAAVLDDVVDDERYATKTRGARYQPGARPIAHGGYAFARHDDHVHLVYELEHVERELDVGDAIHVPDSAAHLVLFERADPGRAVWTTAGEPSRLDHAGEELVLVGVGADHDPEHALGVDLLGGSPPTSR